MGSIGERYYEQYENDFDSNVEKQFDTNDLMQIYIESMFKIKDVTLLNYELKGSEIIIKFIKPGYLQDKIRINLLDYITFIFNKLNK